TGPPIVPPQPGAARCRAGARGEAQSAPPAARNRTYPRAWRRCGPCAARRQAAWFISPQAPRRFRLLSRGAGAENSAKNRTRGEAMSDAPELPTRPHRSGLPLLDLVISVCALVMSGVSIFMANENSNSMQDLVHANSWPFLQLDSGNTSDDGLLHV